MKTHAYVRKHATGPERRVAWARRAALLARGLALVAIGCDDPLVDPAVVTGPRVLAARVQTERDPSVAEPSAGEAALVEWLVASDVAGSFAARHVLCVAEPIRIGAPRCAAPAWDERELTGTYDEPLRVELVTPPELEPGAAWLAWLGACDAGDVVTFDAAAGAFQCASGAQALSSVYRGFVPEAEPNRNPVLQDDVITLDGVPWLGADPASASDVPCAGDNLPVLRAGAEAALGLALGGDDREPLEAEAQRFAAPLRESLVYTHVATLPGLDRAFSAIEGDAAQPAFTLPFQAPADLDVPASGRSVRFHFVVRDERGGVDWLRREACLLPAASE